MEEIIKHSESIKAQASDILFNRGLHDLLSKYGEVGYVGSYELDLMLKKDIDVSLINPDLTLEYFFRLAYDVAELLEPHSLFYRNTRIRSVKERPDNSCYWAFEFEDWNIDVWLVPESWYRKSIEYMEKIKEAMTPELRSIVLSLKSEGIQRGEYGKTFGSKEVYRVVLEGNVRTYDDFLVFLDEAIDPVTGGAAGKS